MTTKTLEEYCAVCKKTLTMTIVQGDKDNSDMVWVECPSCHEIKPRDLKPPSSPEETKKEDQADSKTEGPKILTYPGTDEFEIGDTVHHRAWDDKGEVLEKRTTKGGHLMIVVEFEKKGRKKLLL
jgi:hypothetical protein